LGRPVPNAFLAPVGGALGAALTALGNWQGLFRVRRAIFTRLPFLTLASDVRDVIYLNWVVPMEKVRALVPPGVELLEVDGQTVLTALSYRHGHFAPRLAGPLRMLYPSPRQSNWRLYISRLGGDQTVKGAVLFIKNIFGDPLYTLGTRVFSDVLPSHWARTFEHRTTADGWVLHIDGGKGSAPALACEVARTEKRELPAVFRPFFTDWQAAANYLCLQELAVGEVAGESELAHSGFALPIDVATVIPLQAMSVEVGEFLADCGAGQAPFCFAVPAVHFTVQWEKLVPRRVSA
jgi:hypothetical protein